MWSEESKHTEDVAECIGTQQRGDSTEPAPSSSVTEAGADACHADVHSHDEIKQEPANQERHDEEATQLGEDTDHTVEEVAQSLHSECEVKEEEAQSLHSECEVKEEEAQSLHSECEVKEEEAQSLHSECEVKEEVAQSLHSECEVKEEEAQSLHSECEVKEEVAQSLHSECEVKEEEAQSLHSECEVKEEVAQSLHSECEVKEEVAQSLHSECEVKEEEAQSLHSECEVKEEVAQSLHSECEVKEEEAQSLHSECEVKEEEAHSLHSECEVKEEVAQSLHLECEVKEEEAQSSHSECEVEEEKAQSFYSGYEVKKEVTRELHPDHVIKEENMIGPEVLPRTLLTNYGCRSYREQNHLLTLQSSPAQRNMQVEDNEQDDFIAAQIRLKNSKAELIMETTTKFTQKEISDLDSNENKTLYVNPILIKIEEEISQNNTFEKMDVTATAEKKDTETPTGREDYVPFAEQVDDETPAEKKDNISPTDTKNDVTTPTEKEAIKTSAEGDNDMIRPAEREEDIMISAENEDNVTPAIRDDDVTSDVEEEDEPPAKKRKKRRETEFKESYVDFLSEEEDFVWNSTSWKDTGGKSTSSELDNQRSKRKKLKKRLTEEPVGDDGLRKERKNKTESRKEAKQSGKEYRKKDGSMIKEKQLQENPCMGKKCGHNCGNISEEKRRQVFNHYWSLPAERKKDWLVSMASKKEVKRKRSKDSTYRANTFEYFVNEGEGRRQVCLQFMMKTLDVTQRYIYYTLSNATMGSAKSDQRGKIIPTNKTSETVRISAINFLKKLPALPSHYCRKDSTRLYLPVEFRNIKNLYRIYKEEQISKGVDAVSDRIFREIFTKDFNIGFHVPRKDKCLKCLRFEGKDLADNADMKSHLEEKDASKKRLTFHREIPKKNSSILCTSFDLQKVLNTPYGNSMLLFYSKKYAVYNLCFYESVTRNGFCYIWGETEGKRGGNEIATILQKYIKNCDERGNIKTLILYADSCPGQNKNKIVLAAIHNALLMAKNLEIIQVNYLLPGHTEMTVDSIHTTIENSVQYTTVWAPSQWFTVCQMARKHPRSYNVEGFTHQDFKNYEEFSEKYFEGNLAGKISKIRIATFKKSTPNIMTVKYSMKDDAREESISIFATPKQLNAKYTSTLPITKTKYNDLKKLCDTCVIPKVFHAEYLNFPNSNGKDVLIDTDVEDEVEERE